MKSLTSISTGSISILLPLYSYESILVSDTFLYEATYRLSDTFLYEATGPFLVIIGYFIGVLGILIKHSHKNSGILD